MRMNPPTIDKFAESLSRSPSHSRDGLVAGALATIRPIDRLTRPVIEGNPIRQLGVREFPREGALPTFSRGRLRGHLFRPAGEGNEVLVIPKAKNLPAERTHIVKATVESRGESIDLGHFLQTGPRYC